MKTVRKHETHRGFTLIELLVVVAIIGTLAALLFPAVRGAILLAQGTASGQDGKQVWMGLQIEDNDRDVRGEPGIWPQSGDYANSTDFFRDCIASNWLGSAFTFHFMGAPGLVRVKTDDPTLFGAENNAWCVVLDLGQGSKGETPFMFTRNLVGEDSEASTIDGIETLSATAEPFGDKLGIVITFGGAVKTIKERDVRREGLQAYFNPTQATNPFIMP